MRWNLSFYQFSVHTRQTWTRWLNITQMTTSSSWRPSDLITCPNIQSKCKDVSTKQNCKTSMRFPMHSMHSASIHSLSGSWQSRSVHAIVGDDIKCVEDFFISFWVNKKNMKTLGDFDWRGFPLFNVPSTDKPSDQKSQCLLSVMLYAVECISCTWNRRKRNWGEDFHIAPCINNASLLY